MKKILGFIFILYFGICTLFVGTTNNINATSYVSVNNVGNSINVAKANTYSDFIKGNNVLSTKYMDSEREDGGIYIRSTTVNNSTEISSFCSETKQEILDKLKYEYSMNIKSSFGDSLEIFTANTKNKIDLAFDQNVLNYFHCFYSDYKVKRVNSSQWINNYNSTTTRNELMNNLDSDYLIDLKKLYNKEIFYDDFFDIYGTHLIAYVDLGCNLDILYECGTNSIKYNNGLVLQINGNSELSIDTIASLGVSENTTFAKDYGINSTNSYVKYACCQEGGPIFGGISHSNLSTSYSEWSKNADSNPTIVGYGDNGKGLIPLYDLIPASITNENESYLDNMKKEMMLAMDDYIKNNVLNPDVSENFCFPDTFITDEILVDDKTYKITDSGRFKNPYFEINLNDVLFENLDLFNQEYTKCTIKLRYDASTKNDGVRHVYIYDKYINNNENLLSLWDFTTTKETIEYVPEMTISKKNDKFPEKTYILFNASGKGNDDWYLSNLHYKLIFTK